LTILSRFAWFLVPGVVQGAVGFLMIPLATLRLGPYDYGAFALVTGLTAVGTSLALLGSGYRLAEVFGRGNAVEERDIVSAQVATSTFIVLAAMLIVAILWWQGGQYWSSLSAVPAEGIALSAAAMLGTGWWLVATEILTLTRRARMFAVGMITQSVVNAVTLMLALFVFDLGGLALYVAAFAASIAALCGALVALRPYLTARVSRQQMGRICTGAGLMSVSNTSEAGYQAIERSLLSSGVSFSQLGLYVHAQQYKALIALAIKAGARSVWRDSLDEARRDDGAFVQTRNIWSLCYLAITLGGLTLGAIGKEVIGVMTHGKFIDAAPYAAASIAILLAQHLGKPQTAVLYAHGHGNAYARSVVISLVVAAMAAVLLIPSLGVWGALLAGLTQSITLRLQLYVLAKRLAKAPRQDRLAWWGLGLLLLQLAFDRVYDAASIAARLEVCAVLLAVLCWAARRELTTLWLTLKSDRSLRAHP
jgi:O-antigen/teichoic acid export membrane protein